MTTPTEPQKRLMPRQPYLSNAGTEATPIYAHVEVDPEFTKWFPELRAMEADINNAVDMLNDVAKLKAVLDSEEVQRALKLPVEYATARDNFLAKRAGLLAAIQGMNDLLQGKAMEIYHQAFDAYNETTRKPPKPLKITRKLPKRTRKLPKITRKLPEPKKEIR